MDALWPNAKFALAEEYPSRVSLRYSFNVMAVTNRMGISWLWSLLSSFVSSSHLGLMLLSYGWWVTYMIGYLFQVWLWVEESVNWDRSFSFAELAFAKYMTKTLISFPPPLSLSLLRWSPVFKWHIIIWPFGSSARLYNHLHFHGCYGDVWCSPVVVVTAAAPFACVQFSQSVWRWCCIVDARTLRVCE